MKASHIPLGMSFRSSLFGFIINHLLLFDSSSFRMFRRSSLVALMPLAHASMDMMSEVAPPSLPHSVDEPQAKRLCSREYLSDPAEDAVNKICCALADTSVKISNWILDKKEVNAKIERHRSKLQGSPNEDLALQQFAIKLTFLRFAETLVKMKRQGRSAAYFTPLIRELVGHSNGLVFSKVMEKFDEAVSDLSRSLIIGVNDRSTIRYNFL